VRLPVRIGVLRVADDLTQALQLEIDASDIKPGFTLDA